MGKMDFFKNVTSRSRIGFTLVELIVVIGVLAMLILVVLSRISVPSVDDPARKKSLEVTASLLEEFKTRYGSYPIPTSSSPRYPKSGCSTPWYKGLIDCFIAIGSITKDSEEYKQVYKDPNDGQLNDQGQKYGYKYCVNQNGSKFKLAALPVTQNNDVLYPTDISGNPAEIGNRFLLVISPSAKISDPNLNNCVE